MAGVGNCPKCSKAIDETHENSWCTNCGEPLPEDIKAKLPTVAALLASRSNSSTDTAPIANPGPQQGDSRLSIGLLGLVAGAAIGFLTRPSTFLVGQLPLSTVLTRGGNLGGLDQLLVPAAQASFNQMLVFAVLGGAVGVGIGWMVRQSATSERPSRMCGTLSL